MKYAVCASIIAAAITVIFVRRDTRVLASHIGITSYPDGVAMVQVPYRRDGEVGVATITVGGRSVVSAMPAYAIKYSNDNYFFRPSAALGVATDVRVSYGFGSHSESIEKTVKVTHVPENVTTEDTPDESAPAAATEAVVYLAKLHGVDGKLPAYPATIMEELKNDMRWSVKTGVTPENFVSGLNLWAKKKDLAFRTEKITGKFSALLDDIGRALAGGGTAQAHLQFKKAGRVVGGRMVNVVRVTHAGDNSFIGIHDSMGPPGTDVYRVNDGVLVDYGFSDDLTVLGWGFVQIWND